MAKLTESEALFLLAFDCQKLGPRGASDIRRAFAERVKATHPDALRGGEPADMDTLKAARDLLLQICNGEDLYCKTCQGRGTVRSRMGVKPCGACKGTGDRQ